MKKLLLFSLALVGLLAACVVEPADDSDPPDSPGPKTVVVFDNPQGIYTAVVYDDSRRRDEDKIAEIPAGLRSREIEWSPGASVAFYFAYRINLEGISDFTMDYIPEVGYDRTTRKLELGTKTVIPIPVLSEILSSDALLSNNSYLMIKNNSSFECRLLKIDGIVQPDNASDAWVYSGKRAQYTVAGSTSSYQLEVVTVRVPLPDSPSSFRPGRVYVYSLGSDRTVTFNSEVKITLGNITVGSVTPKAPSNVSASATSSSSIRVSWSSVYSASGYYHVCRVFRSTSPSGTYSYMGSSSSSSYEDTGLSASTTYFYKVSASSANDESELSSYASATTLSPFFREFTLKMWDSVGDGWGYRSDSGRVYFYSLKIIVNGTERMLDVMGSNSGVSYSRERNFPVDKGDVVQIYWVNPVGGDNNNSAAVCAFAVYYRDAQPSPAFNPSSGTTDSSKVLVSRQYTSLVGVMDNTLLGSFTVP